MEFNATFVISAISFILFTVIMNKIFYKPVGNIINERQKFIDDTIETAKKSDSEADNILKIRDEKLGDSLKNSKKIISDKTADANKDAAKILFQARESSKNRISAVKENLFVQANDLDREMEQRVDNLSDLIVNKIFEEAES